MKPTVTVTVPVLDEGPFIDRCLSAIEAQSYEEIIEILVIDGGSTDDTVALALAHPGVTIVDNPRHSQAAGLNLALHGAAGEIIVRVDGHSFVEPTYVEACVKALVRTGAAMVGGQMQPSGEGWVQLGIAAAMQSPVGAGPARFHTGGPSGWTDTVYLGAFWADRARHIGGYAEDLSPNEDAEFAIRMQAVGGVWYEDGVRTTYVPRDTIGRVAYQFYRYGGARLRTILRHPNSVSPRQLAPPIFVLALLSPLRRQVAALYLGIIVVAAIPQAKRDPRAIPGMSVTIPTMHISWGCGFLGGALSSFGDGREVTRPRLLPRPREFPERRQIAVVIAAYNAERTIGDTLASLSAQTLKPARVVVIDDASTDDTARVALTWANALPLTVLRNVANLGPGPARHRGIEVTDQDLIALLDADDVLLPRHLQCLAELHAMTGGIVSANARWWGEDQPASAGTYRDRFQIPPPYKQDHWILLGNFVFIGSMFRRSDYTLAGGFRLDARLDGAEDWDLWIRMIRNGSRVFGPQEDTCMYRVSGSSLTSGTDVLVRYERVLQLALHEASRADEAATLRRSLRYMRARRYLVAARHAARVGRRWDSRRSAFRALAGHPHTVAEAIAVLLCPFRATRFRDETIGAHG